MYNDLLTKFSDEGLLFRNEIIFQELIVIANYLIYYLFDFLGGGWVLVTPNYRIMNCLANGWRSVQIYFSLLQYGLKSNW